MHPDLFRPDQTKKNAGNEVARPLWGRDKRKSEDTHQSCIDEAPLDSQRIKGKE